jgi:hypothetical protein
MTDAPFNAATASAAQCSLRLSELQGNHEWGAKLLANDAATVAELRGLASKIAGGGSPDDTHLLALDKPPTTGSTYGSEIFPADKYAFIDGMRGAGMSEPEVAEALNGNRQYTAEQIFWARNLLNELMGDQDWCRRLNNRGVTESLELKRLSVILAAA